MTEMYMNGLGVQARTDKLNDDVFSALFPAVIGGSGMLFSPLLYGMCCAALESGPSIFMTALAVLMFGMGVAIQVPWWLAIRALHKHTEVVEAETKRLGAGWARS